MNYLLMLFLSNIPKPRLFSSKISTLEVIAQEMASAQALPDLINTLGTDKLPRPDGHHPSVLKKLSV